MRNILKGLLDPEAYRFPSAEELELEAESPPEAPGEEEACEDIAAPPGEEAALEEEAPPSGEEARAAAPQEQHTGPVQYAQLQAELILKQAREEAEQLLAGARAAAKAEQEEIRMGARDEGYREGYAQGISKAVEDAERDREAVAERMEKEVQAFLEKADMAREEVLLQGVIDAWFEEEDSVTVVDFKSDQVAPGGERARAEEYRPQLAAYSQALSAILGRPVNRQVLWFFATDTAVELL